VQTGPERLAPNADRRDTPHPGDDYAPWSFKVVQHATFDQLKGDGQGYHRAMGES